MKYFAFFYPTKNVGGAQLLFARLAVELISVGKKVVIVDYKNGFISNYVSQRSNDYISYQYQDGNICKIQQEVCLIQHLSSFPTLRGKIEITEKSTLLFWSIHPFNIFAFYRLTPIYTRVSYKLTNLITKWIEPFRRKSVMRWIDKAQAANGLYFMDGANWDTINTMFHNPLQPKFLPIPIENKFARKEKSKFDTINIAWIGRVSDAKIHPFENIVRGLDNSEWNGKIIFHVIGFGNTECINTVKNIEVVDHGIVQGDELDKLLLEEVDAVIAMGTAIMEAAALGIPSVLTDVGKSKFPSSYKFKWLFESKIYDLGTTVSRANGNLTMLDILITLNTQSTYDDVGRKCLDYVQENHNIETVVQKVITAVDSSTLEMKDL